MEWKRLMKKFISNKTILKILGIVLFIIVWQILSIVIGEDTFIFPGPFTTFAETTKMLKDSYVYKCVLQTISRMLAGFAIALVLAIIFGIIAGNNEKVEEVLRPTMTIFKSLPTATLVYLFIVLVGARTTPMLIVILVAFPILYESVVGGIKSVPTTLIEASKIDASSNLDTILWIKIPLAIPYVIVGISSSFGLSLKIEIMAEVITGYTRSGLGSAILAAQRSDPTNMVPVFAYSLIAIVIMLLSDLFSNKIKEKYQDANIV